MSGGLVEQVADLYEQIRTLAEDHLHTAKLPWLRAGEKYRVMKIKAYTLDAEYWPTKESYGEVDPARVPPFFLGRIDMSFKVTAVKLPLKYDPDEAELTIDLVQNSLAVRSVVYTQKLASGWFVAEGD